MTEDFTEEELAKGIHDAVEDRLNSHVGQHKKPQAFLIVGQPGAGKTMLANMLTGYLEQDVVFVSGDDFRAYHPRYEKLYEEFGADFVLHTQKFAGKMTDGIIKELAKQGRNLIIEGTMRTKDVPENTCKMLKKMGYDVALFAMLVRPEISYLSTLKRFELMKEIGGIPRKTPKEHHDKVVKAIMDNLDAVHQDQVFDRITIYNRQEERLYDSRETPHRSPASVFRKEFGRMLSTKEKKDIRQEYTKYAGKKVVEMTLRQYEKGART